MPGIEFYPVQSVDLALMEVHCPGPYDGAQMVVMQFGCQTRDGAVGRSGYFALRLADALDFCRRLAEHNAELFRVLQAQQREFGIHAQTSNAGVSPAPGPSPEDPG